MIEHGKYRIVDNNFHIGSVIQQNNLLKKQNSNLITGLLVAVFLGGVVVIYLVSEHSKRSE
jgi:hypothetical protein